MGSRPRATPERAERATPTLIVGIGAASGGLDPLEELFTAFEEGERVAFVLVMHRDGGGEDAVPALVAGFTNLPVEVARDRQPLRPGADYVAPAGTLIAIERGALRVRRAEAPEERGAQIDI